MRPKRWFQRRAVSRGVVAIAERYKSAAVMAEEAAGACEFVDAVDIDGEHPDAIGEARAWPGVAHMHDAPAEQLGRRVHAATRSVAAPAQGGSTPN